MTSRAGKGFGASLELGDGLQGQELLRKELLSGSLTLGLGDRVNLSIGPYGGHETDDPAGTLITGKVRVGSLLGPRTSTAVHVGVATVDRADVDAQDEALTAVDLAVPTELLVADGGGATFSSLSPPGPRGARFLRCSWAGGQRGEGGRARRRDVLRPPTWRPSWVSWIS